MCAPWRDQCTVYNTNVRYHGFLYILRKWHDNYSFFKHHPNIFLYIMDLVCLTLCLYTCIWFSIYLLSITNFDIFTVRIIFEFTAILGVEKTSSLGKFWIYSCNNKIHNMTTRRKYIYNLTPNVTNSTLYWV